MNCLRVINTIYRQSIFKIPYAKYASHPIKFLETEKMWKEKDGVSQRWDLIYKAPMINILNYVSSYLTFSTTAVACGGVYYAAFVFDVNTMNEPVMLDNIVLANNASECLIYLGAFVAFHVAIKVLLSKYVIRLYKNGDEYIAVFGSFWYNLIKKHKFHLHEFKKLNPTFVVSWGESRYGLGKKHGILLDNYFKTPEYLNYLLYKKKNENEE